MTPSNAVVMSKMIKRARQTLPLMALKAQVCAGSPKKLIECIDMELVSWEERLTYGERPSFADVQKLGRTLKKAHRILVKHGLIAANDE